MSQGFKNVLKFSDFSQESEESTKKNAYGKNDGFRRLKTGLGQLLRNGFQTQSKMKSNGSVDLYVYPNLS